MDTRMSPEERQAFLAETRVGILSIPERWLTVDYSKLGPMPT